MSISTAKGQIRKIGHRWYYQVTDSEGKTVLSDNTGSWAPLISDCFYDVAAVRRLENAGHRLRYSFSQLMDQVAA